MFLSFDRNTLQCNLILFPSISILGYPQLMVLPGHINLAVILSGDVITIVIWPITEWSHPQDLHRMRRKKNVHLPLNWNLCMHASVWQIIENADDSFQSRNTINPGWALHPFQTCFYLFHSVMKPRENINT